MTEDDQGALRAAGLYHIISISGLHISLVAMFVFFTLRAAMALFPRFALYHPIKKYAAMAALFGTVAYMFLVGPSVPTVRSVLMMGLVLGAIMLDRVPFSMRLVAVAAMAVLVFEPESLLGPSFQMSFGAVAALIAFYEASPALWSKLRGRGGLLREYLFVYPRGICATSIVATIATAPYSLYHFQNLALYGLIANLVALPLMGLAVMPPLVLAYLLMPLGLDGPVVWMMGKGIAGVLYISHWVAALPLSMIHPPFWPMGALIGFSLAGAFFMLGRGWFRALALVPLIAAVVIILQDRPPDVFISSRGGLFAIRDEAGALHVSSFAHDRFTAQIWARMAGVPKENLVRWPKDSDDLLKCDEQGCRMEQGGRRVAFSFRPDGQAEDCGWADILIAQNPVNKRDCRAPTVIDRFDVWRDGSHTVWLDGHVESAAMLRGQRPWARSPGRKEN